MFHSLVPEGVEIQLIEELGQFVLLGVEFSVELVIRIAERNAGTGSSFEASEPGFTVPAERCFGGVGEPSEVSGLFEIGQPVVTWCPPYGLPGIVSPQCEQSVSSSGIVLSRPCLS